MRLSGKILDNVINVNNWNYATQAYLRDGEINEFYIQLVDLGKDTQVKARIGVLPEHPMRYISQAAVATLSVTFAALDDTEEFSIDASNPFSDDLSIWKIAIPSSQTPKTGAIKLTLTEDGVAKNTIMKSAIVVESTTIGSC